MSNDHSSDAARALMQRIRQYNESRDQDAEWADMCDFVESGPQVNTDSPEPADQPHTDDDPAPATSTLESAINDDHDSPSEGASEQRRALMRLPDVWAHQARKAELAAHYHAQFIDLAPKNFQIDPGWLAIFAQLCAEVEEIIECHGPFAAVRWTQVREKAAHLHVNWTSAQLPNSGSVHEQVVEAYYRAIDASEKTCIVCGAVGRCRKDQPWKMPVCDAHVHVTRRHLSETFTS